MCLEKATKKGINDLPEYGVYYKVLEEGGRSIHKGFQYPKKGRVDIPVRLQMMRTKNNKCINWAAGGHFFRNMKDALRIQRYGYMRLLAIFRIHRKDIEYIGETNLGTDRGITVTTSRAYRIK
jgi:hypothetical protein